MNQLMTMAAEYRLAIMIGILVLLILVSRKKSGNKLLLILTGVLAFSIIYEIFMDEPASRIPNRINRTLNQSGPTESSNLQYYVPPEDRYNLPENM